MNVIDKMFEAFSPQAAVNREVARIKLKQLNLITNSGYDEGGASRKKNSMKGWLASSKSPQKDIDLNLNTLRERSRSLFMTSPLARSAIVSQKTHVIGPGLVMKPVIDYKALNISKETAQELQESIKREWKIWSESVFCDNSQVNNFADLQKIALVSTLMNGDGFALPIYKKPTPYFPYGLRIKLIESDKVCSPNTAGDLVSLSSTNHDNNNRIWNGVEIDDDGAVVAYHIANYYPSDLIVTREWTRVEAFGSRTGNPNVLHIFEAERCEQYRGVPYLAPVIESLKQLSRYTEAELMAAVINGLFTVFVKTEEGDANIDFDGIDEQDQNEDDPNEYQLGNGLINYLKEGESIEIADSKRPSQNFDPFVSAILKYTGAALGIPYEVLVLAFSSNYSASRAALYEAFNTFKMNRKWFVDDFCKPVYEIWLAEAVARGRINAPGFFLDPSIKAAYSGSQWTGPAPTQLDPVKEAQGANLRIANGLSTRDRECTEINGTDFSENFEQLLEEAGKMKQLNDITVGPASPQPVDGGT